jgi:hypothetical protein
MSAFHDNALIGASGQQGYKISRSVRLRSSASAYFNRTFTTPTSNIKWTWSGWVKRGTIGSAVTNGMLGSALGGAGTYFMFSLNGDALDVLQVTSSSIVARLTTTSVYRDPSAWYHIVMVWDSANATSSNRILLYVNGVQVTAFSTATYPSSSLACSFNQSGTNVIGYRNYATDNYYDGYMTELNFIDGQALTPSSFGETNAVTGVWQPKAYTGTYGTNGFELTFADNSNNTAATIGKDYSGNGNNWTPNNISVTAGVTYDSMVDSPTVSSTSSNYCVWNPISGLGGTFTDGNLKSATGTSTQPTIGTFQLPTTGKWYWEVTVGTVSEMAVGINVAPSFGNATKTAYYRQGGASNSIYIEGTVNAYAASSYTNNDVIAVAYDATVPSITWYKNNVSQGTYTLTSTANLFPYLVQVSGSGSCTGIVNFGQQPFVYTPPTGFVALNTQNLPTPTISNGANYMAATLYTGTGSALTVSNAVNSVSFQPDLVWLKQRSSPSENHQLFDSVRGSASNYKRLSSNLTDAETTPGITMVSSLNSNGFTLGTNGGVNTSSATYVGWQWLANAGSTVSNTAGSITSTVSAGATQGFSVATFTTPSSFTNATVGHGLGVAPKMIIVKRRTTGDWITWHTSLGTNGYVTLNTTSASSSNSGSFNGTSSTTWTLGSNTWWQASASDWVAYCFAEVAGFSKFGSYTGNGSADGPFVYLGFRPRYILIKQSSASGQDWQVQDTSREPYNSSTRSVLFPDLSNAEITDSFPTDFLSNGFKIRNSGSGNNSNGATYIYAAFAENPFKISLAR